MVGYSTAITYICPLQITMLLFLLHYERTMAKPRLYRRSELRGAYLKKVGPFSEITWDKERKPCYNRVGCNFHHISKRNGLYNEIVN